MGICVNKVNKSQIPISHNIMSTTYHTNFMSTNLEKFYNKDLTPKPKQNLESTQIGESILCVLKNNLLINDG